MKTKITQILTFFLLSLSVFGKDAWMHYNDRFIDWHKPTILTIDGNKTYIPNPTPEEYEKAGIVKIEAPDAPIGNLFMDYNNKVIYEIFQESTNIIVNIDNDTVTIGIQFAHILTGYFGEDAPTNRNITEKYITEFFAAKVAVGTISALELAHANLLERYFTILKDSPYNPTPNTTWDFPFGQTSITKDIIRRYYIKDGEKVYVD